MAIGKVIHQPVLEKELIDYLKIKPDGVYVDGTLGTGGHALAVLEKLSTSGLLLALDLDEAAIGTAKERLKAFEKQFRIHHANFKEIKTILEKENIKAVDGITLDLGTSSLQLETPERGFSFSKEGPLDMRMDFSQGTKAWEKIKNSNELELAGILEKYGEERYSKKIARHIIEKMNLREIQNTLDLAKVAQAAYPPQSRWKGIHPATRLFQAIRIWVNGELESLKNFLNVAPFLLKPDGRLCVMAYHSLEDRLVKQAFRKLTDADDTFERMTKKPITPSEEEIDRNPRARSAKMRILRKKEDADAF